VGEARRNPRGRRRKTLAALGLDLGLTAISVTLAQAELSVSGNLFVTFNGGILPVALPRATTAPITVKLSGKVRTLSDEHPPALRQIVIKLNRNGHLDTRGLPVCQRRQVAVLTTREALTQCGDALVGTGVYIARISYPEQASFATHGRILAFNSILGGKPAILSHVYGRNPVPITRTFEFQIQGLTGTYGTELRANLPLSLNRFGYLKRISLNLHRTYTIHGRPHSYLSAGCPAAPGLQEASFNFAFASMSFADGRTLQATMTRTCEVAE
jgi:hypothetical protein